LNEVTVSAPINITSIRQWPGSVSKIDSLKLTSGNSYNLAQQVNKAPGILMQQGTLSTNRLTIRGIGSRTPYNSNRIKAYWGNIPLTDGDGVTSIEDIGFNDINSLEILKGPSSALYGAGLGGVILIDPWLALPRKNQVSFQSEAGSYATYSNQLTATLKNKGGFTSITTNHLSTDGYRDNSDYKRHNISLKGKYLIGKNSLHYLYNFRYLNGQIPSSIDSIDFHDNPHKAAASWEAIGGYEESKRHLFSIGLSTQFSSSLYHQLSIFASLTDQEELRPFNRLDEAKQALGFRDKLSLSLNTLKIVAGLEGMSEKNTVKLIGVKANNKGDLLSKTNITRQYLNLFALTEYTLKEKWHLQAAFNLNWTKYQHHDQASNNSFDHRYPLVLSPRLGINYQLNATSNVFAAAGHGFSAPSVEEAQMPDGTFNKAIKPEEGIHFDLGYRYTSRNNNTNAELTAYYMRMSNLLVTKRESEAIFYGVNAGQTIHRGIETQVNHKVIISHNQTLQFNASYAHSINKFEEFIDEGINYQGKHLPGIPAFSAYTSANFRSGKTSMEVNYQHWGKQYLSDANDKSYTDFGVLNAKINQKLEIGSLKANIYFGINNILDKHYASMVLINAPSFGNNLPRYYYPALPVNLYGGLNITL